MNKRILNLALPNIVSNITIPLLGMVDLALMGHFESEDYIGAISVGSMIFNFLYWAFAFLRMGSSGLTAQAYGERNLKESILVLSRALMVAFVGGLLLILLQKPIHFLAFRLLEGSAGVESLASEYFHIRIYAAPATIGMFALTGWFIGMQNARFPMFIAIINNLLNIGFNFFFIYGLEMKSDGVAYGTLLAQYSAFFGSLFLIKTYYARLFKYWEYKAMMKVSELWNFFHINKDIFIRTLCVIFVFTFFTSNSAGRGDIILAVNSLLLQFLMFFSYLMDGFAYAAEALVGKYIGAQNRKGLKKAIRYTFGWGIGVGILFTLVYVVAGNAILKILTDNIEILHQSKPFLYWVFLIPILTFASFVWDGIYIGATASKAMRNTMIASTVLVFVPVYLLLRNSLGNHSLWLALILFMSSRGIFQTIIAKRVIISKLPIK